MRLTNIITGLAAATILASPLVSQAVVLGENDKTTVNFHGSLRLSINNDDCGSPCKGAWRGGATGEDLTDKSSTYLSGNFSHFQFDGSHKLNDKNSVVFKLEWKVDPANTGAGNTLVDFEQYLGIKGGLGQLRAGTILTPYMQSGVKLDPYRRDAIAGRFFIDIYSALHHTNGFGRGRATNTLRYDSPKFAGGLTAQAFISLDKSSNDDHAMGGGLMYNSKSVYALLQYYDANTPGKSDATKIGGKYKFGKTASVFAQYEKDGGLISLAEGLAGVPATGDLSYTADNTVDGADVWLLGGTYNIGKIGLIAQYGERDDTSSTTLNGHTGAVIGASYRMDKNFYYYAVLSKDFNDTKSNDDRLTAGATFTW